MAKYTTLVEELYKYPKAATKDLSSTIINPQGESISVIDRSHRAPGYTNVYDKVGTLPTDFRITELDPDTETWSPITGIYKESGFGKLRVERNIASTWTAIPSSVTVDTTKTWITAAFVDIPHTQTGGSGSCWIKMTEILPTLKTLCQSLATFLGKDNYDLITAADVTPSGATDPDPLFVKKILGMMNPWFGTWNATISHLDIAPEYIAFTFVVEELCYNCCTEGSEATFTWTDPTSATEHFTAVVYDQTFEPITSPATVHVSSQFYIVPTADEGYYLLGTECTGTNCTVAWNADYRAWVVTPDHDASGFPKTCSVAFTAASALIYIHSTDTNVVTKFYDSLGNPREYYLEGETYNVTVNCNEHYYAPVLTITGAVQTLTETSPGTYKTTTPLTAPASNPTITCVGTLMIQLTADTEHCSVTFFEEGGRLQDWFRPGEKFFILCKGDTGYFGTPVGTVAGTAITWTEREEGVFSSQVFTIGASAPAITVTGTETPAPPVIPVTAYEYGDTLCFSYPPCDDGMTTVSLCEFYNVTANSLSNSDGIYLRMEGHGETELPLFTASSLSAYTFPAGTTFDLDISLSGNIYHLADLPLYLEDLGIYFSLNVSGMKHKLNSTFTSQLLRLPVTVPANSQEDVTATYESTPVVCGKTGLYGCYDFNPIETKPSGPIVSEAASYSIVATYDVDSVIPISFPRTATAPFTYDKVVPYFAPTYGAGMAIIAPSILGSVEFTSANLVVNGNNYTFFDDDNFYMYAIPVNTTFDIDLVVKGSSTHLHLIDLKGAGYFVTKNSDTHPLGSTFQGTGGIGPVTVPTTTETYFVDWDNHLVGLSGDDGVYDCNNMYTMAIDITGPITADRATFNIMSRG